MHVPRIETRTLDETVEALDLGQTPADIVFLSFSDSDLNALARAYDAFPEPKPSLRIASLAALRHPFSVDLYLEKVCARAKLVVARVLGGADYWRYGVDELRALARRSDLKLALLPGDRRRDARLDEASTLESDAVERIWRYFDEGGPDNMAACLAFLASEIGGAAAAPPPVPVSAFGRFDAACFEAGPDAARALIVFYRSIYLANDLEPIEALARALRDKGFAVTSVFVTSLKDEAALSPLRAFLDGRPFDVVLNATAFSARLDAEEGTALDALDAPVLQVVLAGVGLDAWRASQRGLGPSDLAMHVALPEIDGRILTRAISFKAASPRDARTEFAAVAHRPLADRVDFAAELARRWASLRRKAPSDKRLACVLPDYPARGGRTGYAVGLDTPASAVAICETLRAAGYDVACGLDAPSLIAALAEGPLEAALTLAEYEAELASTPADFRQSLVRRVGRPRRRSRRGRRGVPVPLRAARQAHRRGSARPRRRVLAQGRLSQSQPAAAPRLCRVLFLAHPQGESRRDHSARRARHARMAAGQGGRAQRDLRARSSARPDAGHLSVHRQQSRRSGAGQAPHRRGHDRPSDAAVDRRRVVWRNARARRAVRRIRRGAGARSAPGARHCGAHSRARPRERAPQGMRRRRQAARRGARRPRRLALRPQGDARSATACMCSAGRPRAPTASPPGSISARRRATR